MLNIPSYQVSFGKFYSFHFFTKVNFLSFLLFNSILRDSLKLFLKLIFMKYFTLYLQITNHSKNFLVLFHFIINYFIMENKIILTINKF